MHSGFSYHEPLFRPPAEAYSAILQVTIGCSWNKCAFCEMYTSKKFRVKEFDILKQEIKLLHHIYKGTRKVFLADGDAFVLSAGKLLPILHEINSTFGKLQRISCYALPKNILSKSKEELIALKEAGLNLLYIGIESGNNELLKKINKGETAESIVEGINRAKEAGINASVMILSGLGGKVYSEAHAIDSARIINAVQPKYLSVLTLSLPYGETHYKNKFDGIYEQQSVLELAKELKIFVEELELTASIFRSNHVSNHLVLEGSLGKDKLKIIEQIENALRCIPEGVYPENSNRLL